MTLRPGPAFPLDRPARIAVFASGRGSNLRALLNAFGPRDDLGRVVLVVSDKPRAKALERAREAGVEAKHIAWSDRERFEAEATALLDEREVDLVCLAGFMRLLSRGFVERYRDRLLNIHPSLLPSFRGLHPQRQALEAGATETGCTIHFVDAGVDTGEIVLQCRVPVLPEDDEATLTARILEREHEAYPEAVRLVLSGRAEPRAQADES
ncbi:MAG TPA: phosphoribosylglycinamide formyltransferase [Trueperaceae bacterium]